MERWADRRGLAVIAWQLCLVAPASPLLTGPRTQCTTRLVEPMLVRTLPIIGRHKISGDRSTAKRGGWAAKAASSFTVGQVNKRLQRSDNQAAEIPSAAFSRSPSIPPRVTTGTGDLYQLLRAHEGLKVGASSLAAFIPIVAGRLSGVRIGAGASEGLKVVVSGNAVR